MNDKGTTQQGTGNTKPSRAIDIVKTIAKPLGAARGAVTGTITGTLQGGLYAAGKTGEIGLYAAIAGFAVGSCWQGCNWVWKRRTSLLER